MKTIHAFIDITARVGLRFVLKFCISIIAITFETAIEVVTFTIHTWIGVTFIYISASKTITSEANVTLTCKGTESVMAPSIEVTWIGVTLVDILTIEFTSGISLGTGPTSHDVIKYCEFVKSLTFKSITSVSVITFTFKTTISVYAVGIGRTVVFNAFIYIFTFLTIASITKVALTDVRTRSIGTSSI